MVLGLHCLYEMKYYVEYLWVNFSISRPTFPFSALTLLVGRQVRASGL